MTYTIVTNILFLKNKSNTFEHNYNNLLSQFSTYFLYKHINTNTNFNDVGFTSAFKH